MFKLDGEIISFTDKQRIQHHHTSFTKILKELLQAEKKRPQLETRKLRVEKFTSKGKHTGKVGNNPHTNMISKPATVKRVQMHDIGNAFEIKRPTS